jgi:hypothetical protein
MALFAAAVNGQRRDLQSKQKPVARKAQGYASTNLEIERDVSHS